MKTNEEKAEYMRLYRKTHPLYMQKHYAVNKLKWKQFKQSHESNIKNMVIEELLEEIRELPSLYTHQRDWIERTEVLTCIKKKLSPKEDK